MSNWLHAPNGKNREWVKWRNDEFIPLLKFAAHRGLPDATYIVWRDKPDFEVRYIDGTSSHVEMTTTSPQWFENWRHGHQRRIEGELMKAGIGLIGHGFSRTQNNECGVAIGSVAVLSDAKRVNACERGLTDAIARKLEPDYPSTNCDLLIYCDGFGMQTIDGEFPSLVARVSSRSSRPPFNRIFAFHEIEVASDGLQELTVFARSGPPQKS